ncbi:hypothetical protein [Streptomyces violarus]|uniref:hypothetical protein n=1 Tax=Streptomyces violarus TaxID=67380 RepID=UPI0021C097D4|nr:hypothetical protein [Streptomyces violarus]MCT9139119.1 hypothetical protein [Streptomyces violarus]
MTRRQQPRITEASAVPYRSTECRIGTHRACAESAPVAAPTDLPVVVETCACLCHSTSHHATPADVER